jgi:hypothetical protein
MKQNRIFTILFAIGALVALSFGNVEAASVGVLGCVLAEASVKITGLAFLQIVPGKFVVTNPRTGALEEVPYMSRAEKALYDQLITLGRANPVTQGVIGQGGISFDPITYYVRAIITGQAGRQKILGQNTIQIDGVTNFPNAATLPQFYNFCFDRIAVRYAVATSANANAASITGWSSVRGSMPAALGNGHLLLSSNKNTIVETPISDFTSVAAITGGGERDYDGGVLEKPRFLLELISFEAEIVYSANQTVPSAANNTYAIELALHGVQARLKA